MPAAGHSGKIKIAHERNVTTLCSKLTSLMVRCKETHLQEGLRLLQQVHRQWTKLSGEQFVGDGGPELTRDFQQSVEWLESDATKANDIASANAVSMVSVQKPTAAAAPDSLPLGPSLHGMSTTAENSSAASTPRKAITWPAAVELLDELRERGALALDDRLDALIPKTAVGPSPPPWLQALRYVVRLSLMPFTVDEEPKWTVPAHAKSLEDALICLAAAEVYSRKDASLACAQALRRFRVVAEKSGSKKLPPSILQRAKELAENLASHGSKKQQPPSPANRWNQVKNRVMNRVGPSPPAVMDDILGLIGLDSVKHVLIDEYERIRLSKESGASSYNFRFEGESFKYLMNTLT
jgi:hypothetical protein